MASPDTSSGNLSGEDYSDRDRSSQFVRFERSPCASAHLQNSVPRQSIAFLFGERLYVFAMKSMDTAIALVARNLAQAMMMMLLILRPMVLLSGAWGPPRSDEHLDGLARSAFPARRFIDFGYGERPGVRGQRHRRNHLLSFVLLSFSLWWFRRSLAK